MVPQQHFGYKFYKNLFFPYNCLLHSAVNIYFWSGLSKYIYELSDEIETVVRFIHSIVPKTILATVMVLFSLWIGLVREIWPLVFSEIMRKYAGELLGTKSFCSRSAGSFDRGRCVRFGRDRA